MLDWWLLHHSIVWLLVHNYHSIDSKPSHPSIISRERNFAWEKTHKLSEIPFSFVWDSNLIWMIINHIYIMIVFLLSLADCLPTMKMILMNSQKMNLRRTMRMRTMMMTLIIIVLMVLGWVIFFPSIAVVWMLIMVVRWVVQIRCLACLQ